MNDGLSTSRPCQVHGLAHHRWRDQIGERIFQDKLGVLIGQSEPVDPMVDTGEPVRCGVGTRMPKPSRVEDVAQPFWHAGRRMKVVTGPGNRMVGGGDGVSDL
ncbi:hypothetical protein ACFFX0_25345 [Citricoccus parietis]|uniref:Uncharacterized protein n=1 Tax=Citricoccus parietis TaxID=592307 RepID=A0ABV5G7D2_9MICC